MNTSRSNHYLPRVLGAAALALGALLLVEDASAIIGMPLTPMSYAGVARRTTRRAVYAGAAAGAYGGYGYGYPSTYAALPPGCVAGTACSGVVYQPVYSGTTVVYVTSPP